MTKLDWLKRAAERSSTEAGLLGQVFATFQERQSCSPAELARLLGCDEQTLRLLSLCERPSPEAFTEQVKMICERFGLEPRLLSKVLRQVDFMDALKPGAANTTTTRTAQRLQLAARDRRRKDDPTS